VAYVVKDARGRSPYWTACYTDAAGRRLKKSTRLTNKKKALEVALALDHGEHLARSGAFTEARLRELFDQTLERVIGAPVQHYTAETWCATLWNHSDHALNYRWSISATKTFWRFEMPR
jgi:hypothetical protein